MKEKNKEDEQKKWYQNAWFKRLGLAGFLFFLIKGLIWLAVLFGAWKWFN